MSTAFAYLQSELNTKRWVEMLMHEITGSFYAMMHG